MLKLLGALMMLTSLGGQDAALDRYAEGQVWEYRTRPGDEGSLLKIQEVEAYPNAPAADDRRVYHVSLIGVRFGPERTMTQLQHLPVSRETLDASVLRRSDSAAPFPAPDEGIAMWREAEGGVFTIPVAELVDIVEQAMRGPE